MTPYDYHTVGRLNQSDRLRERDEIRQAKLLHESDPAQSRTPDPIRRPRVQRAWNLVLTNLRQAVRPS